MLEKVKYSDWAAPIGICEDYKVIINPSLNPSLHVDEYPMQTAEDLFTTLARGQAFSKLNLPQAYQQVTLEPSSCKYVTINTLKVL